MAQYPSRMYVSLRTRYLRRIYFAGAAGAIILIAIITLFSLSERKGHPETDQERLGTPSQSAQAERPQSQSTGHPTAEPARFSMPLNLPQEPSQQEAPPGPKVEKLSDENQVETAAVEPPQTPIQIVETYISADAKAQIVIDEAMRLLNARPTEVVKAREMLNELLGTGISEQQHKVVKEQLSKLADKWLFNKAVYPQDTLCTMYRVQSGDLLSTIGKTYKVPWEILQQINGIPSPEALQADQSIKVINGPFHAKIYRSSFTMDLYLQDTFVRSFPVGLGKPGYETPTGVWVVRPGGKLIKPRWTDPDTGKTYEPDDPNYPLGSRWISLDGLEGQARGRTGFAIHGIKDPHEIGVAKSRGCIRLYNGDVMLVYDLLMPGESKVVVVD
jgi:LysM repeat protein